MPLSQPPQQLVDDRHVAMTDRWSQGDDRDRGRIDRGVHGSRSSRSPGPRHSGFSRESKHRERSRDSVRSSQHREQRHRERSIDRRQPAPRSPTKERREEVPRSVASEKNKGRELLNTRGSSNSRGSSGRQSSPASKRRKSRTPSPPRSHYKKSRKEDSRSPARVEDIAHRPERRRSTTRPHRRSMERGLPESNTAGRVRERGDPRDNLDRLGGSARDYREQGGYEGRRRSPSPQYRPSDRDEYRREDYRREDYRREPDRPRIRGRSPLPSRVFRGRSPERATDYARSREHSPGRRSPLLDSYEPRRSRQNSPGPSRTTEQYHKKSPARISKTGETVSDDRSQRRQSPPASKPPKDRKARAEEDKAKPFEQRGKHSRPRTSGANSIEVSRDKRRGSKQDSRHTTPQPSGANSIEVSSNRVRRSITPSGANSVEVNSEKMAGRAYYGNQGAFNQQQQMQAAFPLKQYQSPQVDPRQYSQSPQHMTPGSYHGSPQAQSPYSNHGGSNWGPPQQQYSPQP